jgi:hypothetical protein
LFKACVDPEIDCRFGKWFADLCEKIRECQLDPVSGLALQNRRPIDVKADNAIHDLTVEYCSKNEHSTEEMIPFLDLIQFQLTRKEVNNWEDQ